MKKLFLVATVLISVSGTLYSSDHLDAPNLTSDGQADVADLYAFQSPTNASNAVLILTVNPFAASDAKFGTDVTYEFNIDNTGDAVFDTTYAVTFDVGQNLTLTKNGTAVAMGASSATIPVNGGGNVLAGRFEDPFFFDFAGFNSGFNFTGADAFAGADISAIVLEVPSSELGGPNIGVQARTVRAGSQVDRKGRPAINTALIPSARKQEFNEAMPSDDPVNFATDVNTAIAGLSNQTNADNLTAILLPDLLTFDTSDASGFLNGRQLADDVIDAELGLLSGGAVTGDMVNSNDVAFPGAFPYLAPANVPEPSSAVLAIVGLFGLAGFRRRQRTRR